MRTAAAAAVIAMLALSVGALVSARAEGPSKEKQMKEIQVGDTPGAFALNDHEGKAVRLGDAQGSGWFALAFYPKASTGG